MTPSRTQSRPLRLAAIVAGVPVLLVAIAWIALTLLFPPARVKALVTEQLQRSLSREVRFEGASLGLWPPVRLSVKRPELAEPGGFASGVAFGAQAVNLDLDVPALLGRKIVVRRLAIEEPTIHLLLRTDGTSNFDSLGAPPQPGAPPPAMDLDVREFAIRGGHVLMDDMAAGRRVTLAVSTRTSLAAEQGGQRVSTSGHTELSGLAFGPLSATKASDLQQGLAKLVWKVDHRGKFDAPSKRLALEQLALTLGGTKLTLTGVVDDPGPHAKFDLHATGDGVDFGEVLSWVAVADAQAVKGISGKGQLAFDVTARGAAPRPGAAPAVPALRGWVEVKGASFRYAGAPADVRDLALRVELAPDSVALTRLSAVVAGQPLAASALARRLSDPLVNFALRGNLDLAAIGPMVAQSGAQLAGHANLDIRGSGRAKDPGSFALDGRAELKNVSVEAKDLPKRIEKVNGVVLLSPQRAAVQHLTATAGQSSYTIDATVTRPLALMAKPDSVAPAGVTFDFRSPYLDLAELLPTTPGAPFLPNAKGTGSVAIERLKQGKLDVKTVRANVALNPAALESESFSLAGYGGTVRGSAKFDLRDTARPVYALQTTVEGVQADDILSAWTPAKGLLRGGLNTNIDFSGAGSTPDDLKRSLTLVGLAALTDGTLGPGPTLDAISSFVKIPALREVKFKDLKLPMRIERGRLISDPVKLSGSSGDWLLAGAVGFDGALDYAVSVTLTPEVAAALQAKSALAAGALSDDQGRILLDLRVTGSAKSPKIAWDTRAMRDRLAGRASAAITEQRDKLANDAKAAAQQAIAERLGFAADSAKKAASIREQAQAAKDSIRKAAGGALRNLFGKPKP
ncbi:MAG: AsmA family protein, partial [Candidatus Eisenbacteria bacterium]|nr:AsmA family protein [Candidatus Eisenbacteria bacterium]